MLEDHMYAREDDAKSHEIQIDTYTQIILDKPIQSKKKISKTGNFLFSPE